VGDTLASVKVFDGILDIGDLFVGKLNLRIVFLQCHQ
jgi:hypothetical protein